QKTAATLKGHIKKHMSLLCESMDELHAAMDKDIPMLGKTPRAAVLVAGLMENYYTCSETIFVRISQFFENNLSPDKLHQDLLERMTLEVENTRPQVLSDNVYRDLLEIMRFRHFKRYYFGTAYDWERLEELLKRIERLHRPLIENLEQFILFLDDLLETFS
ncbi:MAG: hypothetical protein ACLFSA_09165, partial [Spirochaetaceae bacterium]